MDKRKIAQIIAELEWQRSIMSGTLEDVIRFMSGFRSACKALEYELPLDHWKQETVLGPLGMTQSTYYVGRYEFRNNQMMTFVPRDGRRFTLADDLPDEEFLPQGQN